MATDVEMKRCPETLYFTKKEKGEHKNWRDIARMVIEGKRRRLKGTGCSATTNRKGIIWEDEVQRQEDMWYRERKKKCKYKRGKERKTEETPKEPWDTTLELMDRILEKADQVLAEFRKKAEKMNTLRNFGKEVERQEREFYRVKQEMLRKWDRPSKKRRINEEDMERMEGGALANLLKREKKARAEVNTTQDSIDKDGNVSSLISQQSSSRQGIVSTSKGGKERKFDRDSKLDGKRGGKLHSKSEIRRKQQKSRSRQEVEIPQKIPIKGISSPYGDKEGRQRQTEKRRRNSSRESYTRLKVIRNQPNQLTRRDILRAHIQTARYQYQSTWGKKSRKCYCADSEIT